MSKRLKRIAKIIELAEMEMEQAAKTMGYMRNQLLESQAQLNSLLEYQKDYVKKPAQSGLISPIQLQTHNTFADKLVQAISTQNNAVDEAQKMLEMAEQAWHEKRIRVKALEAMYKRIKQQADTALNKQEQRFLDELTSQRYAATLNE